MYNDFLLIRKMKQGDDNAFDLFVHKYYQEILSYCHHHCFDKTYAEDLTQETFIRFFTRLPDYHYKGKTLLVIANRDVNNRETGIVTVPGLMKSQKLKNLLPSIDNPSKFQVESGQIKCDLGQGRVHVFEIDTPNIQKSGLKVYRQKQKVK